jgi:outer membrane translocation and assembly module TamA
LLRAHPLLHDGVIRDGVFGRVVASGGAEWRRWRSPVLRLLRIAPAAFVDVARAFDAPQFADPRAHVDIGAGIRLAIPGAGVIRADVARGLRDGEMAVSVGWTR